MPKHNRRENWRQTPTEESTVEPPTEVEPDDETQVGGIYIPSDGMFDAHHESSDEVE
ncbi:hypothetical protein SEA_CLARKSON_89 [Mycobacterium phage Clarkson]|uniref:Uncharacterized protein n=1 Tax=Mycobacterium phage Corazon TaxID=2652888 RepID=A0A5P8DF61_9CAUD|nr:hypothetical protein SEA_CORAZON_83 [Mycobacterium phage Corazon]URP22581.1 hypothetical protein SEA_HUPHLEPUFF_90 [Mycobacterium phage Huphlepuff]WAA20193.1 hypothetical protein SEA_CLARKSON_89 [Mycobacterium phage Clarkson]